MNQPLPLKPLHLPPAPSWWPPAPGWWVLAVLLIILLGIGIWLWLGRRRLARQRRWLEQELARIGSKQEWAQPLHRLLRRAMQPLLTSHQPDEKMWLDSLRTLAGDFSIEELLTLEQQRYQYVTGPHPEALEQARHLLLLAMLEPRKAKRLLKRKRPLKGRPT